jgi:hypothetical protein
MADASWTTRRKGIRRKDEDERMKIYVALYWLSSIGAALVTRNTTGYK